jgi:hypothetical protein
MLQKIPRGKWYCKNCTGSAPPKKKAQRKSKEKVQILNPVNTPQNEDLSNR